MRPGRARTSGLGVPLLPLARWVGWVAPVRPTHGVLVLSCPSAALRVCSVLGRLAPVHRCARSVCCVACAVSWATWLPFTGAPAGCVVLRVRCPRPLGSCSLVRRLGVLLCVCGVLGHLAPVHRCARSVCVCCVVFRSGKKFGQKFGRTIQSPMGGLWGTRIHYRQVWMPCSRVLVYSWSSRSDTVSAMSVDGPE